MSDRNFRDIFTGAALSIFGFWFAWYSIANYGRGTLEKIGNGLFPAAAAILLTLFGILILSSGFVTTAAKSEFRIRVPFFVLASVVAFALIVRPFGLVPAIIACTLLSSLADLKARLVGLTVLCVVLCGLVYLIFRLGLGLLIPMINWPF